MYFKLDLHMNKSVIWNKCDVDIATFNLHGKSDYIWRTND